MVQVYGRETSEITVNVGEEFAIELPSRAMAGYAWEVEVDANQLASSKAEASAAAPEALGQSVDSRFVFRALSPGDTSIQLRQRRPWPDANGQHRTLDDFSIRVRAS